MREAHGVPGVVDFAIPGHPAEAFDAAVERVTAGEIGRGCIVLAVEIEAGAADTVGDAAGERAEMR